MVGLIILLSLLALGYYAGSLTERKHLESLTMRESQHGDFLISQVKTFPGAAAGGPPPTLIVGEAVIATDYMKSFLSKLRKIFGGELRSYHSLLTRARREALQRIVEQARQKGSTRFAICVTRPRTWAALPSSIP